MEIRQLKKLSIQNERTTFRNRDKLSAQCTSAPTFFFAQLLRSYPLISPQRASPKVLTLTFEE